MVSNPSRTTACTRRQHDPSSLAAAPCAGTSLKSSETTSSSRSQRAPARASCRCSTRDSRRDCRFEFCTDVRRAFGPGSIEPELWAAVADTITVEPPPAGATITVSNVVLRNSAGATVRIIRPVKLTAAVGRDGQMKATRELLVPEQAPFLRHRRLLRITCLAAITGRQAIRTSRSAPVRESLC